MMQRLEARFDRAVDASLREVGRDDLTEQLRKYLADAHAIEEQAIALLVRGPKLAGSERLATIYDDHLAETRDHAETISARLQALGADPSSLKDSRRATPRRHKRSKGSSSRNARRRSGSPVPSTTRSGPRSRHRKSPARRARESPFRGATATAVSPTMSGLWP